MSRYAARRKAGLCHGCPAPSRPGKTYCLACATRRKDKRIRDGMEERLQQLWIGALVRAHLEIRAHRRRHHRQIGREIRMALNAIKVRELRELWREREVWRRATAHS